MSAPLSGSQLPVYTWDDISKHKSAESLWVVIEGKVYDITSFQEEVRLFSPVNLNFLTWSWVLKACCNTNIISLNTSTDLLLILA